MIMFLNWQRIVTSFAEVKELALLAGDCFVNHDDARWQVGLL